MRGSHGAPASFLAASKGQAHLSSWSLISPGFFAELPVTGRGPPEKALLINLLGTETAKCVVCSHEIRIQHSWGQVSFPAIFGRPREREQAGRYPHVSTCVQAEWKPGHRERLDDSGGLSQERKHEENIARGACRCLQPGSRAFSVYVIKSVGKTSCLL